MNVTCQDCQKEFDDADCSTICPHDLIMPRADLEQKKLGLELLGKKVFFNHRPDGVLAARVNSVGWNGMVGIEGMPGEFAPHLFTISEES